MAAQNPKEIKLRAPTDFHGERTKTGKFLSQVSLYLRANPDVYDTDDKKIIFALSFMNGGTAAGWAEAKGVQATPWGTWEDFKTEIRNAFSPVDDAGDARHGLKTLKQTGDVEDYISQFRILKGRAGINEDVSLIEYFVDGLNPKLVEKIYNMETVPVTLENMMKAAAKYDGQWKRARAITGKLRAAYPAPSTTVKREPGFDLNRLSNSERMEHMRKGLCFICHKPGHRSGDHKKDGTVATTSAPKPWQKKTGEGLYKNLRSMMAELDEEEREKALAILEDKGF
jgi:hypothetical protein